MNVKLPVRELLLPVVAVFVACASSGRLGRSDISTIAGDPGPDCALLGEVTGDNAFGSDLDTPEGPRDWARADALQKAHRLGATHVKFLEGERVRAAAYLCQSASQAGGCTKDTDCKGDRVCEEGQCVDPKKPSHPAS